jgi:cation transport ATPase
MEVEVNYLAVLLAALSSMVVGSIWYAPGVFGNVWMKLAKVDPKKQMTTSDKLMFLWVFLLSLLTAYVLAHVSFLSNQFFGNSFLQDALSTAFWLWLGLVVTRLLTHNMFDRRPGKLTLLALGNELLTIMLMGFIIGLLGV